MKTILLFGAGKSATVLIDYLIANAGHNSWKIVIADANKEQILSKTNHSPLCDAIEIDITNTHERSSLIKDADIVISLMPPALHYLIADDCIAWSKNLLTASYIDDAIKARKEEIEQKGLLFLCEMGLDPGIDHMSAMQLIDKIKMKGGNITSFKSHCGGLVSPESDDNPWHYKISWNPRNIVLAGKSGALYKINGEIVRENYEELFDSGRNVKLDGLGTLSYYPNRDSLSYIDTYQLPGADTFIRTTLRHPDFMYGWNNIIELRLTDEEVLYETDDISLAAFFVQHLSKVDFQSWSSKKIDDKLGVVKLLTDKLNDISAKEQALIEEGQPLEEFSVVNEMGDIVHYRVEDIKIKTAEAITQNLHELNLLLKQLFFLGLQDETLLINKGKCSAADVLQFALEKKLVLQPEDKDMIVMLHEIEYEISGKTYEVKSELIVKGENSIRTAMAKTVGLPLGIAAKLILNEGIQLKGLHIPIAKEIYSLVLDELKNEGIIFNEKERILK